MVLKKKQKRLVFFLPNFILGGAGESIFKLSKFLVKYNFSILIISLGKNFYKKDFKKINCEIIEINSSRTFFSIFKIRKLMIKETKKTIQNILVKDYMSRDIITFRKSDSIYFVMQELLNNKISGAPVINKFGKLVGIISETDIMKNIVDSQYYNMPISKTNVSKYMKKSVDCISPNETIFGAASEFIKLNRKRFPVMISDKIVGIISRVDIISAAVNIRSQMWGD